MMERLTQWFGSSRLGREVGVAARLQELYTEEELLDLFAKRLAEYEDTGLKPEDFDLGLNAAARKRVAAEYYGLTTEQMDHAVDLIRADAALREREQNGWISVKERLPALEKEVLICDIDDERKYMDIWSLEDDMEGGVVWQGKNGEWYSICEATHWMPLPEPPKEGTEG